jgi:3'(2'), 5'-bisphosphate nucleotidase
MIDYRQYLLKSIQTSLKAGNGILEVYQSNFSVEHKADDSPLTLADRRSHEIITENLVEFGIPILSEEGSHIPFDERLKWDMLWIVDPLDGTKEFIKRNDEFTVNIALVGQGKPLLGVIFIPAKKTLYFAAQNLGAYKLKNRWLDELLGKKDITNDTNGQLNELIDRSGKLPLKLPTDSPFIIVGSRSHGRQELEAFVEEKRREFGQVELTAAGSALKFCLVAEGSANIYPRFGPTCEWDTAAGQAVVENSGGQVVDYETGKSLVYNKENLLNPWFIVRR